MLREAINKHFCAIRRHENGTASDAPHGVMNRRKLRPGDKNSLRMEREHD
jgi:hypothetical protein